MKWMAILSMAFLISSCASFKKNTKDDSTSYLDTVKLNFDAGEKAFSEKSYEEAISYFEHVRSKYPYSKYAALSDLRVADTYFAQEKWLEAADAYDFYIRFHPRHENSAYAWFQVAKSHFKAMPADFFLLPSNYVKDQTATKDALEAIDRYLSEYPEHEFVAEAKDMRKELRSKLALRDMHVARFYAQKKKWQGAIQRYERVVEQYPDTECAQEARSELAKLQEDHPSS